MTLKYFDSILIEFLSFPLYLALQTRVTFCKQETLRTSKVLAMLCDLLDTDVFKCIDYNA
jgi:hypothetical protein